MFRGGLKPAGASTVIHWGPREFQKSDFPFLYSRASLVGEYEASARECLQALKANLQHISTLIWLGTQLDGRRAVMKRLESHRSTCSLIQSHPNGKTKKSVSWCVSWLRVTWCRSRCSQSRSGSGAEWTRSAGRRRIPALQPSVKSTHSLGSFSLSLWSLVLSQVS